MKLSEFKYSLPKNLIAKFPADPRDSSRMMILDKETGEIEEKQFSAILDIFKRGDCIVLNETKVFPARLFGKKEKTNAKIEVMLLRELKSEERIWDVLVEPARKVRIGNKIYFDNNKFYCEVIDNTTSRGRTVRFSHEGNLFKIIERIGEMPLPEYIKRDPNEHDKVTYQTVFANPNYLCSIAPPSAGLHFTPELLKALEDKGVKIAKLDLNIGQGIFENIEVEDLTKHRMYSEYFEISRESAETINKSLKNKKQVYAVGTSVLRALESSVLTSGATKPNKGWTDKFIYPPYDFKVATAFITTFHPPASPSLLVSAAFGGKENIFKAYKRAMKSEYRFLAYGDALLIR
ncbi:MAG: tRNA preQ1(34) S-adenosylmethionine ribosyltransferase-isomerase QueA [Candidatus Kapabacteria bacterium]|jgi:S-adenosylmethionine:tRNA ribosyltransferase-isomerase|nr:tRNA preQ1(34) S-adenosylmethionine ribosyltransferase-isomerase QueA [Candidatus Kapabacteria bacterium]